MIVLVDSILSDMEWYFDETCPLVCRDRMPSCPMLMDLSFHFIRYMVFIRGNKFQAIEACICSSYVRSNILFWSSFKRCVVRYWKRKRKKKTYIVKCKETREQEISSLIFERCLVGGQLPSILLAAYIGSGIQNPKITVAFIVGWISLHPTWMRKY